MLPLPASSVWLTLTHYSEPTFICVDVAAGAENIFGSQRTESSLSFSSTLWVAWSRDRHTSVGSLAWRMHHRLVLPSRRLLGIPSHRPRDLVRLLCLVVDALGVCSEASLLIAKSQQCLHRQESTQNRHLISKSANTFQRFLCPDVVLHPAIMPSCALTTTRRPQVCHSQSHHHRNKLGATATSCFGKGGKQRRTNWRQP